MPYKIVIEAQGNKGGKTYLGDIVVTLDKETIPVQVELRTKPEPDQHERIRNGFKEFWGSDEIIAKNIFIKNIYWLIMIFILLFIDYPLLYSIIFEENIIKRIFLIPFLIFWSPISTRSCIFYLWNIYAYRKDYKSVMEFERTLATYCQNITAIKSKKKR